MSDPRAIAQVVTAASGLSGAGVTMDVSNASLFDVGQLVELYPQQHGDGAPLARAGQTVRYQISAIAGAQLTGEMNPDAYLNPPQVEVGWIIDGTATGGISSGDVLYIDGVMYPRTRAGFTAAFAAIALAGGGKIVVPPGPDILWDTVTVSYPGDDLTLEWDRSVALLLPPGATDVTPFSFIGAGAIGVSAALASDAFEAQPYVIVSNADFATMEGQGMALGSVMYLTQTPNDAAVPYSDIYVARVTSLDDAGNAIYLSAPLPKDYTTAKNARVLQMSVGQRNRVVGLRILGNGNTGNGSGLMYYYQSGFSYDDISGEDLPNSLINQAALCYGTRHGSVRAVRCGDDNTEVAIGLAGCFADTHVGSFDTVDCGWGVVIDGAAYSNFQHMHDASPVARGFKAMNFKKCTVNDIITTNSVINSGFTVAGESWANVFNGIQVYGNYESGILITGQGTGNVVRDNVYSNIMAKGNRRGSTELNIQLGSGMTPNNQFMFGDWGGPTKAEDILSGGGNSFGHDCVYTQAFAAGDYTAATGNWNDILDAEELTTWSQQGKSMHMSGYVLTSSVTATPIALRRLIPNGRVAAVTQVGFCAINENGTMVPGFAQATAGSNLITFSKATLGAFATLVNLTSVFFSIDFEVQ